MANHGRWVLLGLMLLGLVGIACSRNRQDAAAGSRPVVLDLKLPSAFAFVAYGDTRFHDPSDTSAANAAVRRALVAAIAKEKPAFVSIGGDVVYTGESPEDWAVWDSETAVWRENHISVYPALGNHDLKGDLRKALGNYFARFPELHESRYYALQTENTIMLVLDSALDEVAGSQGDWLRAQLDQIPAKTDFVFLIFHHPVYTSSSDEKAFGGGHTARASEEALGRFLEERQKRMRARIVVFNGHVHNYERHEHGGITYFVTGGGGAHAYAIQRHAEDLYKDAGINFHYLLVRVNQNQATITMKKLELENGTERWSEPDKVTIAAPQASKGAAD